MSAHYDDPRDDDVKRNPWMTSREISHDEAREIAHRLINSHFRKEPHARASIPARPDYDDDLLIVSYIFQQRARDASLREAHELLAELLSFAHDAPPPLQARVAKALAEVEGGGNE